MSAGRGRRRCLALAALALCACCSHAEPLPFGRLFTTPAERQYLDERRRAGQHGASPPARSAAAPLVAPTAQPAAAPANVITFRGFIQGRNGRTAAWLSGGEALARRPATPGAPADQMAVKLPSGAVVRLRPGQSYDPRRGATLPALMLALVVGAGWTLLSGRLFTMPAERQYLDERRRAGQHGAPPAALEPGIDRPAARAPDAGRAAAASVAAPTAQPAPVITFRGFIQGRNGRTAAWLSGGGEALARCPAATGAPADQAAVRLPGGVVVRLRSGQSYDPRRGAVLDATGAVP